MVRTLHKGVTAKIKMGNFREQVRKSKDRHKVYKKIGVKTDKRLSAVYVDYCVCAIRHIID